MIFISLRVLTPGLIFITGTRLSIFSTIFIFETRSFETFRSGRGGGGGGGGVVGVGVGATAGGVFPLKRYRGFISAVILSDDRKGIIRLCLYRRETRCFPREYGTPKIQIQNGYGEVDFDDDYNDDKPVYSLDFVDCVGYDYHGFLKVGIFL